MPMRSRSLVAFALVFLLGAQAMATWSIILIDLRTGEIAVGTATCLEGFDIRAAVPLILVGRGAACAQSFVDATGQNRQLIRAQLLLGTDPSQILALLAAQDPGHSTRQYGIVDASGRTLTFTGAGCFRYANGVTGTIPGTMIAYAIQGNILTGAPVISATEQAILATAGDLPTRLMAGMEAARSMGGDGRCSCPLGSPTSCGAPPPSFQKSAHIGCVIVARLGDTDGACNASVGCAAGSYYLNFNAAFLNQSSPDPVFILQQQFQNFRNLWLQRADHYQSTVTFSQPSIPANGLTTVLGTVQLRNWQGAPVNLPSAALQVSLDASSTATATIGPVTAQGNGLFTFPVTGGTNPGLLRFRVRVVNPFTPNVLLAPFAEVQLLSDALWSPVNGVSAAFGGTIPLLLSAGPAYSYRAYAVALSGSGSVPGISVAPGLTIPLNFDAVTALGLELLNSPYLPNTSGVLSSLGGASANLVAPSQLLIPLAGSTLTFSFITLGPIDFASNPISVTIQS